MQDKKKFEKYCAKKRPRPLSGLPELFCGFEQIQGCGIGIFNAAIDFRHSLIDCENKVDFEIWKVKDKVEAKITSKNSKMQLQVN